MQLSLKNILKVLSGPILLLAFYLTFFILWKIFGLPSDDRMIMIVTDFISRYGLIVVFIAAIIEGLLLLGNYFPGGAVIFLGVIAAHGNIPRAAIVVLTVCLSFSIAYTANYYLGKYGWYKLFSKLGLQSTIDSMEQKLSKHVFTAIISSYWMPNLAAVCSTAAGIMRLPFGKFFIQSSVGIVAWNIFWGILVYMTGDALLKLNFVYLLCMFFVWCLLIVVKVFYWDKKFNI